MVHRGDRHSSRQEQLSLGAQASLGTVAPPSKTQYSAVDLFRSPKLAHGSQTHWRFMGCIVTQEPRARSLRLGRVLRKDHQEDQRGDKWRSLLTRQGSFSGGQSEPRKKAADPSKQSSARPGAGGRVISWGSRLPSRMGARCAAGLQEQITSTGAAGNVLGDRPC